MTERNGGRPDAPIEGPAHTLTSKARSDVWVVDRRTNSRAAGGGQAPTVPVPMSEPAPTFTGKSGHQWIFHRPATTIVASFRPDIVAAPGYRVVGSRQNAEGSVKITEREAATLQSFPPDYPWQGTRSKQFEQIGNAVPPLLARHVLASVVAHSGRSVS